MLALSTFYHNKVFSLHFVDEEDNLVLGYYLTKGEKLYSDLFSHHQPLAYVFSAGVSKITRPNSVYLLIKRHREVMIAISLFFSTLLALRFGLPMMLALIIFELNKLFLLGNLFLSESLVVYPVLYILGIIFKKIKNISKIEVILIGLLAFSSAFLLAPIWPLLLLLVGVFLYQRKEKFKSTFVLLFLGGVPIMIVSLIFGSFEYYLKYAIWLNLFYYAPLASADRNVFMSVVLPFLTPILTFFDFSSKQTITLATFKILFLALIINLFFLVKKKDYKPVLLILIILGLSNTRYVRPGEDYYRGFHILPYFSVLCFITIFTSIHMIERHKKWYRYIVTLLFLSLLVFHFNSSLFKKDDIENKFYINYSRQVSFGEIVKILKKPSDRLFVAPDEWLVYWQADISHASKMVNFYAWMNNVSDLAAITDTMFRQNKPEFVHLNFKGTGFERYLEGYRQIKKDGKETDLYVLERRLHGLSSEQKNSLEFHNVSI